MRFAEEPHRVPIALAMILIWFGSHRRAASSIPFTIDDDYISPSIFPSTSLILITYRSSIRLQSKPTTMNSVLALVFFACIAGSMASSNNAQLVGQIVQQGQAVAQAVIGQLQQQLLTLVQSAVGQLSTLVGSLGRFDFDFSSILGQLQTTVDGLIGQVLGQVLGGLQGIIGGTYPHLLLSHQS